jgi:hypothetical protein
VVWPERASAVLFLWFILLWAMFVLWSFVFAWHFQYAHRPAIRLNVQPRVWCAAALCGVAFAVIAHFCVDPQLRLVTPKDYPSSLSDWLAMSLFALGFEPLFFCFAPFAFFIRLLQRQELALVLTVLWGIFILALRLGSSANLPPIWVVAELMLLRVLAGFVSVYFYLKGGALVVWWMVLLVQLRYLADLSGTH